MKRGLSIINTNHSSFRAVLTFVCDKGLVLKITILLEKLFANFILQILKWTEWLVKENLDNFASCLDAGGRGG